MSIHTYMQWLFNKAAKNINFGSSSIKATEKLIFINIEEELEPIKFKVYLKHKDNIKNYINMKAHGQCYTTIFCEIPFSVNFGICICFVQDFKS